MARRPSPAREAGRMAGDADGARLPPWLEEAEPDDEGPTHTLVGRGTLWLILGGLLLLLLGVAGGVLLSVRRDTGPIAPVPGADVPLIRAPGPWKQPADGLPGTEGRPVEGQGQILFDAGTGAAPEAAIDVTRLPEEPMLPGAEPPGTPAPPPAPSPGRPTVLLPDPPAARRPAAPEAAAEPAEARPGAAAPAPPAAAGPPATVQLGAYSSAARAREAFEMLAARHQPLAGLAPQVMPVARADAPTLHRLRVRLPDRAAADRLCARLAVAGDACTVVE